MRTKTILTLSVAIMATGAFAQDKSLTIASWGGSYQEAQSKALFQPASQNTGISIKDNSLDMVVARDNDTISAALTSQKQ